MIIVSNSWVNNKEYDGNTRKFGITYKGANYIVKCTKGNNLSVICEYVASNFIQQLGYNCHTVYLGRYNNQLVDVILDFTSGSNYKLHSFKDTKQSSEDTDISTKEYTYSDVLYLIDKHIKLDDAEKERAKTQFWQMFIVDAILGNRDRHWGNWGYLSDGDNYKVAPIYDNGGCLYPNVCEVIAQYTNHASREQFMRDRVFTFPASLFKVKRSDRSYRTNYYEMFSDLRLNKILARQVKELKQRFSYTDIFNMIRRISYNSEINMTYQRFFTEVVTLRYMCIIERKDFSDSYKCIERMLG